ncbi:MAG: hypothetical protein AAB719_01540 [Patescibacteria group bacterium]
MNEEAERLLEQKELEQAQRISRIALEKGAREIERAVGDVMEKSRKIFRKEGETFEDGDAKRLVEDPPQHSDFPFMILVVAMAKDTLDWVGTALALTIIGIIVWIFVYIVGLVLALALFMWCFSKSSGGWWKKKIIRYLWIRYALAMCIELIPGLNLIPANTIFILMVHYREKKIVKLFNLALEEMKKAGILKYI